MLVAGEVVVVLEGEVVVEVDVDGWVVLDEVVVVVVVVVLLAVLELVVGLVEVVRQSRWASTATVLAPWSRFVRKVGLTVAGRFVTVWANAATAWAAPPQSPDSMAEETESSWPFRLEDWPPESRPAPPPQATRQDTANPSPPASRARGAWRIRGPTLETGAVGFGFETVS